MKPLNTVLLAAAVTLVAIPAFASTTRCGCPPARRHVTHRAVKHHVVYERYEEAPPPPTVVYEEPVYAAPAYETVYAPPVYYADPVWYAPYGYGYAHGYRGGYAVGGYGYRGGGFAPGRGYRVSGPRGGGAGGFARGGEAGRGR